jgi:hypothetical protein
MRPSPEKTDRAVVEVGALSVVDMAAAVTVADIDLGSAVPNQSLHWM